MPSQLRSRMLFCDWHMPNHLPEIKIDYERYFEGVKQTGAETLIFMAKTAHGACLFPSQVGVTNQTMHGDLFGEIATRAKAAGLEFIAYYNMVLSWELPKLHPEWAQLGRDGEPLRMFLYPCSCMSQDGFREYVAEHMAEIARNYPIDGFFLDLQYFAPQGCFCDACRDKYQQRFGQPLEPDSFGTVEWRQLLEYQVDVREQFIGRARERCDQEKSGLSWSWNGCGSPHSISDTLHHGADYLSTEAHPPGYLHASHATRFCEGMGLPFTLFMPESQGSWGDWTITTPETMKTFSAIALSHGGSLNVNHVPYPCGDRGGQVPQVVWDTIAATFDWVKSRESHCLGRSPVPVAAVLHSATNARLLQAMSRAGQGARCGGGVFGNEHAVGQLLMETHTPWEIRPDNLTLEDLQRYELVILPYVPYLGEELADKLRAYVDAGGKLLANDHTGLIDADGEPLDNFATADLFGVELVGDSPYSVSYLDKLDPAFSAVPDLPLLLKDSATGKLTPANHALYCQLTGHARALGYIMDPVIESDFEGGTYVYHDHAPPGSVTESPGIVSNRFGQGQVVYLPVPFLGAFRHKCCPFLKQVFRILVNDVLGVSGKIRLAAPVSFKSSWREDADGWLLHLVHAQQETDSIYADSFYRSGPVTAGVRPPWPVAEVREVLTGQVAECALVDGWCEFQIPGLKDHAIWRVAKG